MKPNNGQPVKVQTVCDTNLILERPYPDITITARGGLRVGRIHNGWLSSKNTNCSTVLSLLISFIIAIYSITIHTTTNDLLMHNILTVYASKSYRNQIAFLIIH